jgi:hypothetical protein
VQNPLLYYDYNVVGTINLLEVMAAHGCKKVSEVPEKAIRGGWEPIKISYRNLAPIFQNRSNASLFYLIQNHIAIEKLLALRTELGNLESQRKTTIDASKNMYETMPTKIGSKISSSPHSHFTEHLANVFEKSSRESN